MFADLSNFEVTEERWSRLVKQAAYAKGELNPGILAGATQASRDVSKTVVAS